ncbi:hypothetical protein [Marinobacter sp.]|uniref:hypothetical protein n=1 Tax=Marinobacter sp. TaxID=50741 RepID=UPI00356B3D54
MESAKSLNVLIRQLLSNTEAMDCLSGSDRNFITSLIQVQERSGNKKLTSRQKNQIRGILQNIPGFLEDTP